MPTPHRLKELAEKYSQITHIQPKVFMDFATELRAEAINQQKK
jgi:hypothetical protein